MSKRLKKHDYEPLDGYILNIEIVNQLQREQSDIQPVFLGLVWK